MIDFLLELFKKYPFEKKRLIMIVFIGVAGIFIGMQTVVFQGSKQLKAGRNFFQQEKSRQLLRAEVAALKKSMEPGYRALAPTARMDWMLEAVRQAAGDSGLSLTSVSPQSSLDGDDFERISLMIEARGRYHQVGVFLEKLENHAPWILIGHLRLEKVREISAGDELNVFALLSAYHQAGQANQ